MRTLPWATMPTDWILDEELPRLRWGRYGSDATAALALFIALLIKANRDGLDDQGLRKSRQVDRIETSATYDVLQDYTMLSRTKIATGLRVLTEHRLVEQLGTHRARMYRIRGNREKNRWAKLPQAPWYRRKDEPLDPFRSFTFRNKLELNALKLYMLVAAFRDNRTQLASISYNTISHYSGIDKNDVSGAISLLLTHRLIQVVQSRRLYESEFGYNAYRLTGLASGPVPA